MHGLSRLSVEGDGGSKRRVNSGAFTLTASGMTMEIMDMMKVVTWLEAQRGGFLNSQQLNEHSQEGFNKLFA